MNNRFDDSQNRFIEYFWLLCWLFVCTNRDSIPDGEFLSVFLLPLSKINWILPLFPVRQSQGLGIFKKRKGNCFSFLCAKNPIKSPELQPELNSLRSDSVTGKEIFSVPKGRWRNVTSFTRSQTSLSRLDYITRKAPSSLDMCQGQWRESETLFRVLPLLSLLTNFVLFSLLVSLFIVTIQFSRRLSNMKSSWQKFFLFAKAKRILFHIRQQKPESLSSSMRDETKSERWKRRGSWELFTTGVTRKKLFITLDCYLFDA